MLKYIGSKRRLVPALGDAAAATGARSAVDLFCGTTRVAQAFKAAGMCVTACDSADYAAVLAQCYIATDGAAFDSAALADAIRRLNALPGEAGYVTDVFCRRSRFFQPFNGERIDAIRAAIEDYSATALYPVLLTALLRAADRVDSTTGVQMAYLKQWSPRSFRPLELTAPTLLPGTGRALHGDATRLAAAVGDVDLVYLDPPYNQHRYEANYHIWQTLVRGDEPEHYGVACKRTDLRGPEGRSPFNSRRTFAGALAGVLSDLPARMVMLSYNDESWVSAPEIAAMLTDAGYGCVTAVGFGSARYVGARIGIHDPSGRKVGTPGRMRNVEWVFLGARPGDAPRVADAISALSRHGGQVLAEDPIRLPAAPA